MKSYLSRDYLFYTGTNSAVLLRGIDTDVTGVGDVMQYLLRIGAEGITITFFGAYLLISEPVMALALMFLISLCLCWFLFFYRKK